MTTKVVILSKEDKANEDIFGQYIQGVVPLMQAQGVGASFQGVSREGFAGTDYPDHVLVLDFESPDAAREFFGSDDYRALIPLRDQAFEYAKIFIAEEGRK